MLAPPPYRFRLKQPVGLDQANKTDDVAALQEALGSIAQYHGKEDAIGRHDGSLDAAIRTVQHRFGLKADGVAKPGGPTEFLLNAILAGGAGALAPDPARTPDRASFRQRLLLKGAVGEAGHNDPDDEATVRHGLALLGHLPLGAIVPGNRLPPRALGDGIERLLRRHGRPPARTLIPGSPAAATLAKELGIAYADKLPEEAPRGPLAVADRQGGTPRPHSSEDAPSNAEMRRKPFTADVFDLFDEREDQGRWDREDRAFYDALRETLFVEKGWSKDAGGTWRGISQDKFYTPFKERERNNPQFEDWPDHVGNLTEDQVILLYRQEFWERPRLEKLLHIEGLTESAPRLVNQVFDFIVNSGQLRGVGTMQSAINDILESHDDYVPIKADGIIGPATTAALRRIVEAGLADALNDLIVDRRVKFLGGLKTAEDNPGWTPRAESYRQRKWQRLNADN